MPPELVVVPRPACFRVLLQFGGGDGLEGVGGEVLLRLDEGEAGIFEGAVGVVGGRGGEGWVGGVVGAEVVQDGAEGGVFDG